MLVLPRYAFSVWFFGLFRSKQLYVVCGSAVTLSLVLVVSLVSLARGQAPAPSLLASNPSPSGTTSVGPVNSTTLAACAAALNEARHVLDSVATMQAVMEKRERVRGRLEPLQQIEIKVRRAPRGVYMRWRAPDEGQEVIWRENANGNQILVHPGGWRGRLLPMVRIDPNSPRVLEQSRRPIESAGLWAMTRQLGELVAQAQKSAAALRVDVTQDQQFAGRKCTAYRLVRAAYTSASDFQSLVIYIDAAAKVPVGIERYIWTVGGRGAPVLDEYYAYRDLRLNAPLSGRDFDAANPAYHFGDAAGSDQDAESIGSKAGAQLK
ncbi:MAG TPA: DUF1571 domain-containing protein [Pirellulales bacterium]